MVHWLTETTFNGLWKNSHSNDKIDIIIIIIFSQSISVAHKTSISHLPISADTSPSISLLSTGRSLLSSLNFLEWNQRREHPWTRKTTTCRTNTAWFPAGGLLCTQSKGEKNRRARFPYHWPRLLSSGLPGLRRSWAETPVLTKNPCRWLSKRSTSSAWTSTGCRARNWATWWTSFTSWSPPCAPQTPTRSRSTLRSWSRPPCARWSNTSSRVYIRGSGDFKVSAEPGGRLPSLWHKCVYYAVNLISASLILKKGNQVASSQKHQRYSFRLRQRALWFQRAAYVTPLSAHEKRVVWNHATFFYVFVFVLYRAIRHNKLSLCIQRSISASVSLLTAISATALSYQTP